MMNRIRRASWALVTAAAAVGLGSGCYELESKQSPELTSFDVFVNGVFATRPAPDGGVVQFGDPGLPIAVVQACAKIYGSQQEVPPAKRGTAECPYAIPRGEVELDVTVTAIGRDGKKLQAFTGPVSFQVVPGDLTGGYDYRWMQVTAGVGRGVVKVEHLYSDIRLWVSDAPPEALSSEGAVLPGAPEEPEERTYATGISSPVIFEDPTVASVQLPDPFDPQNQDPPDQSPLLGQFLSIGRPPTGGSTLKQSCSDDPENDGKDALLVVTGTDPTGFFVTDLTACRQREVLKDIHGSVFVRTPEPDGFYPGRFASMFIYNYSYPEGLDVGDLLWGVSGSVQEFTGTTQLTFPAWNVAENVRTLPEAQWNKWLSKIPITELTLRLCGGDDKPAPFVTDALCGHNKRNFKMESLESSLVRLKNVRFSNTFVNCDRDGDGTVPFFCEQPNEQGVWGFGDCTTYGGAPSELSELQQEELACNVNCVTSQGEHFNKVCSEEATYVGFGQYVIELGGPGPAAAHFDESLPSKIEKVQIDGTSRAMKTEVFGGSELRLFCNTAVHYRFGEGTFEATAQDARLEANTTLEHIIGVGEPGLEVIAAGDPAADAACFVSLNGHAKINLITKDAVPELQPNCDVNDPDQEKAKQCRYLRGARFDVVGHLRHVRPARPRWAISPRDKDDLCCRPGPGLMCPKPILPCK